MRREQQLLAMSTTTISYKVRQYFALVALVIHSIRGDFYEAMRTDVNINRLSVIDLLCVNSFCMFSLWLSYAGF